MNKSKMTTIVKPSTIFKSPTIVETSLEDDLKSLNESEYMETAIPNPKKTNELLPWSEKYRPTNIANILYHDKITLAITSYMDNFKLPHLLFYGPPGTGKTSCIIAIAKHYYKDDYDNMIMVLNASEERGIETVRNRIKQFVISKGLSENPEVPPFKLIILDEIDAMTEDAQAILRKVIEKYVNNVRFCFICNYLKKINPAIQSRCVIFRFNPIPYAKLYEYMIKICEKEKILITENAINLIIKRSNGDMRKLLNILQSLYMHNNINNLDYVSDGSDNISIESEKSGKSAKTPKSKVINENSVSKILSCPTKKNIIDIMNHLQQNNLASSYEYIQNIINKNGISLIELVNNIYEYCMDYLINKNKEYIKYSESKVIDIIKKICIINENITYCNNENIQLISFISVFYM
jgi:replication factor C subunit 3/5